MSFFVTLFSGPKCHESQQKTMQIFPGCKKNHKLDRGSIRSIVREGFSTPYRLTKEMCQTVPSSTMYLTTGDLHLVLPILNLPLLDPSILITEEQLRLILVLLGNGGLPHVLPLGVHLIFIVWTSRGDHPRTSYSFLWEPSFML